MIKFFLAVGFIIVWIVFSRDVEREWHNKGVGYKAYTCIVGGILVGLFALLVLAFRVGG